MFRQTGSLSLQQYSDDAVASSYINESIEIGQRLLESWHFEFNNGHPEKLHGLESPGTFAIYGYDALYVLAYALHRIRDELDELTARGELMEALNRIIVNDTDFIGATGRVMFDGAGDRINGLYSFCNVLENGSMSYFGNFYRTGGSGAVSNIDFETIIFPTDFTEKGMIPRSDVLVLYQIKTINVAFFMAMLVLLCTSILVAFFFIAMLLCFARNKVIKAASWRLNILLCVGAILLYLSALLYCADERMLDEAQQLNVLCNVRLWAVTISVSEPFMPIDWAGCSRTF